MKFLKENLNIKLYVISSFFGFPAFWVPAILLYFIEIKGVSESEVFMLFGAYSIMTFFWEVPTGVVADLVSRKASIILGYLAVAVQFFIAFLLPGIWSAVGLVVIGSIGVSLISGAMESLLYDSLDDLGRKGEYRRWASLTYMTSKLAGALYVYIGGVVAGFGLMWPLLLSAIFYLISAMIFAFIKEPNVSSKARKKMDTGYLAHTTTSIKKIFSKDYRSSGLTMLFITYGFYIALLLALKYLIPSILENNGGSLEQIGLAGSLSLIALSLSAMVFFNIIKGGRVRNRVDTAVIVQPILLILMVVFNTPIFLVISLSLLSFGPPIVTTAIDQYMNDRLETHERATMLSFRSMLGRGYNALMVPIFGLLLDKLSVLHAQIFLAIWMVLAAGSYIVMRRQVNATISKESLNKQ